MIEIERIYNNPLGNNNDGGNNNFRVLIDRLWPRGLSKDKVKIDLWLKDIAPTTSLRKWFSHDEGKWDEFKIRYFKELDDIVIVNLSIKFSIKSMKKDR